LNKYLLVFSTGLQNVLQRRSSLIMDRVGGIAVLLTLYYFWSSLLSGKDEFAGYTRIQMLSYVLVMNLLRAFVFTGRGWELVSEIASGRISSWLLRPIQYEGYSLALDLSQKVVHLAAAVLEVGVLLLLFRAPLYWPAHASTWGFFALGVAMSSLIYFQIEFLVASVAFWTSESGGPLFCFDLFLQFAAGLFFPLDVLPSSLQTALRLTPFPYIVFFPLNVYLERMSASEAGGTLLIQLFWLVALYFAVGFQWRRGLRVFAAEGG